MTEEKTAGNNTKASAQAGFKIPFLGAQGNAEAQVNPKFIGALCFSVLAALQLLVSAAPWRATVSGICSTILFADYICYLFASLAGDFIMVLILAFVALILFLICLVPAAPATVSH